MVSFSDAHRLPGGLDKFLFDKVMELEKDVTESDFAISPIIKLNPSTTAVEDKWEHKMGVRPEMWFMSPTRIAAADGFSFEITKTDEKYVYYKYTSKGTAEFQNAVQIIAIHVENH